MGENGNRRARAVRLTEAALALLQRRLREEWRGMSLEGRITRSVQAGMLDVSIITLDRILKRKGNDRTVLQHAFERVGLDWSEDYCEPLQSETDEAEPVAPVLPPPPDRSKLTVKSRRPVRWISLAASLALLCSLAGWGIVREYHSRSTANWKYLERGRKDYHAGHYALAKQNLAEAVRYSILNHDGNTLSEAIRLQGEVHAAEGDLRSAVDCFERALVIRSEFKFDWGHASLLEVLGVAQLRLEQYEEAESNLRRSIQGLRRWDDYRGAAASMRSLGTLFAAKGNRNEARRWFSAALEEMKQNPDPGLLSDIKAQRAMLLSEEGHNDMALAQLEQCLSEWKQRNHQRWIATTLLQMAKVQRAAGRTEDSLRYLAEAKPKFEAVGDRAGVEECSKWLAQADKKGLQTNEGASAAQ